MRIRPSLEGLLALLVPMLGLLALWRPPAWLVMDVDDDFDPDGLVELPGPLIPPEGPPRD
jgi:hypothetical protein